MCQSGIDLHGLMLAVDQLSGREASLRKDVQAWADYLLKQGVPEASEELGKVVEALETAAKALDRVEHHLDHLHEQGHGHEQHITATTFSG